MDGSRQPGRLAGRGWGYPLVATTQRRHARLTKRRFPPLAQDGSETADVNTLHINADGRFFVSGGSDKKVVLWNYDEGSRYYEGMGHSGSICRVKISPDEKRIISVGTEGGIYVWKIPPDYAGK